MKKIYIPVEIVTEKWSNQPPVAAEQDGQRLTDVSAVPVVQLREVQPRVVQPEDDGQRHRHGHHGDGEHQVVAHFGNLVDAFDDRPAKVKDGEVDLLHLLAFPYHAAHCVVRKRR